MAETSGELPTLNSRLTSLMWERLSMPQKGLQFLLMTPTTFPVGLRVASAAVAFNCTDKTRRKSSEFTYLLNSKLD